MLRCLRRCFSLLPWHLRGWWLALVPLSVVSAAGEAAGAGAVYLLIEVLSDPARAAELPVVSSIVRFLPRADTTVLVLWLTGLVAAFYLLKNAFLAAFLYLQFRLFHGTRAALARALFDGYLDSPYALHLRRSSAELIHRVTDGAHRMVNLVLGAAVAGLSEILVVVGILTVLVATSPLIALIAVTGIAGVLVTLVWLTQRRVFALGEQEIGLRKQALRTLQEALEGMKEIRIFGREDLYRKRFAGEQGVLARLGALHQFLEQAPRLVIESLFVVATVLVVALLAGGGRDSLEVVPLLGLYAYAGFRVIPSCNRLLLHLNNFWYGSASVDDLYQDFRSFRPGGEATSAAAAAPLSFHREIAFERITYAYEPGRQPILSQVTFVICRGESLGIVGATGAGKSTLVDLLLGLLEPTDGRITVDGVDIRRRLRAWRQKIGYVPQTIFLTDDTLRRNIAFGLTAEEIDEARVAAAIRLARLDDLVASLPKGLDTVLGERGVRLSGGQRQRVAIARALYHDPELLIFDEATSALDGRAEQELGEALRTLRGKKTLLVVAHRLSTIRSCDRLVFLRHGRVEGRGTYEELARHNPAFSRTVGLTRHG